MVTFLCSVLLPLSLLFITTANGRRMKVDNINVVSASRSLLDDSTISTTTTNSDDVEGLMTLIQYFPGLIEVLFPLLTKDPCYPQKLSWIQCSNHNVRRVTALYLGGKSLIGPLPDFSSMDALQTIDLHQNLLTGAIPEFLATFPELTYLNLANNYFTGSLPLSLANNKKIKLISGNPTCSSFSGCSPSLLTPPTPTVQFLFPPPTPTVQFQLPPPTPRVQFQLPPPTPNVQFQFPSGGGGGGNDDLSRFDLPDSRKRKKSKLPKILGFTIPPSVLVAVGGAVFAVCRHRRRKATAAAAVSEIAVEVVTAAVS